MAIHFAYARNAFGAPMPWGAGSINSIAPDPTRALPTFSAVRNRKNSEIRKSQMINPIDFFPGSLVKNQLKNEKPQRIGQCRCDIEWFYRIVACVLYRFRQHLTPRSFRVQISIFAVLSFERRRFGSWASQYFSFRVISSRYKPYDAQTVSVYPFSNVFNDP